MRKKEKQVTDPKELVDIMRQSQICRIGLLDHGVPYIVPVNFGFEGNCIYFHCAKEGRKLDIIRSNDLVCFELEADYQMEPKGLPCNWSMRYKSIIGYAHARILEDHEAKKKALNILISHYAAQGYDFPDKKVEEVCVVRLDIESMEGKRSGY